MLESAEPEALPTMDNTSGFELVEVHGALNRQNIVDARTDVMSELSVMCVGVVVIG